MRPCIARANEQLDPRQQLANTPPPPINHTRPSPISIHQITSGCSLLLIYRPWKWTIYSCQIQVERKTEKVDRPNTDVLSLTVPRHRHITPTQIYFKSVLQWEYYRRCIGKLCTSRCPWCRRGTVHRSDSRHQCMSRRQHSEIRPVNPRISSPAYIHRQPDITSFHLGMWQSSNSNSTTFELRTFSPDSKFDECFKHFVVECEFVENPCSTTDSYAQTAREHRQTSFFLKFNLSHKLQ